MKPSELFGYFAVFRSAMDSPEVPQDLKAKIAREFCHSLPPAVYCHGAAVTRAWVQTAIESEIQKLQAANERDSKAQNTTEELRPAKSNPRAKSK